MEYKFGRTLYKLNENSMTKVIEMYSNNKYVIKTVEGTVCIDRNIEYDENESKFEVYYITGYCTYSYSVKSIIDIEFESIKQKMNGCFFARDCNLLRIIETQNFANNLKTFFTLTDINNYSSITFKTITSTLSLFSPDKIIDINNKKEFANILPHLEEYIKLITNKKLDIVQKIKTKLSRSLTTISIFKPVSSQESACVSEGNQYVSSHFLGNYIKSNKLFEKETINKLLEEPVYSQEEIDKINFYSYIQKINKSKLSLTSRLCVDSIVYHSEYLNGIALHYDVTIDDILELISFHVDVGVYSYERDILLLCYGNWYGKSGFELTYKNRNSIYENPIILGKHYDYLTDKGKDYVNTLIKKNNLEFLLV